MNHVIDLAVGCHYFLPGLQLPPLLSPDGATCKRQHTSDSSLLLIYRPRKDERLSWPSWLTCSGRFTHNSGHPSAAGRSHDRESSPVRHRRSTTVPRDQPFILYTSYFFDCAFMVNLCVVLFANCCIWIWYLIYGVTSHICMCCQIHQAAIHTLPKFPCLNIAEIQLNISATNTCYSSVAIFFSIS